MKAFLDPDAEWHVALAPILAQPSYRGAEAVRDLLLEEIPSVMDGFRAEVLEVREAGDDAVIVEVRFVAKGRASGASIEQPFFHSYGSREQALEAVWLRG
jgi:ketosteroid isomerase-like protein